MSNLKFHWFLPTNGGDGRHVVGGGHGVSAGAAGRPASVPYLGQIARSAERFGFEAALTPTGAWCEDAWVATAMLSSLSERLKFLVAFRPGLTSPYVAAQMAGTFQNLSGGRLALNVVTGGESHEQRMFGDFLDKEERYERCDEFLAIVRALWTGEPVTFEGKHLRVEDAVLPQIPDPLPEIYFGGSSPIAGRVAARHVDVYLTWGEPPAAVAEKVELVRRLAAEEGRELRFGIRLHTIARDTSEAAWAEADRLLAGISEDDIRSVQEGLKLSESVGQQRMLDLNKGSKDGLVIHPNLWAGVGLVRGGAGTALLVRRGGAARARAPGPLGEPRSGHRRRLRAVRPEGSGLVTAWGSTLESGRVSVVVGNPKPRSRTLAAATYLARQLVGRDPDHVVDLADLGPRLLDWQDEVVADVVAEVGAADLVVFASPTYKGAYTGLLKLFLDRFATDGLRGVAVPLMLGAGPAHAMAPELTLRPVLTEIGGLVPGKGLYVVDSAYEDPEAYRHWLDLTRPAITAILDSLGTGVSA